MKPVWALINRHDRTCFAVHLFSDSPVQASLDGYVAHPEDQVHAIAELGNEQLAELIRDRQIDILVDLNAYSHPDRLALFVRRPAPVTAAWFNMYATSGLPGIDYVIGDPEVVRPEEDASYSEKVIRLPVSYLTFEVAYPVPPVAAPPCLERGHLTFGSLVSQYKITPQVLDAWAEILRRATDACLLLANSALKSVHNREYVTEQFQRRSVARERLTLRGPADHFAFLRHYDDIDLALDSFPYNGGTTTTEAIWQGVPVLTFDGDRWASRTSQSILRHAHLGQFVAKSVQTYVEMAVNWARDTATPGRLKDMRTTMRPNLQSSPVCDADALTREMEAAYRTVCGLPRG